MDGLITPSKEPKELKPRTAATAIVAVVLFLALVARLYDLQLVRGAELGKKSQENYKKELVVPAPRGKILDHRGRLLASNRPSFDIYITPEFCRPLEEVVGRLATLIDLSPEEAAQALKTAKRTKGLDRSQPFLVKLDIGRDKLDMVLANEGRLPGVDMIPSPHRRYGPLRDDAANAPFGPMLAHVVGYMSQVSPAELAAGKGRYRQGDFIGRRGIERAFESELRGVDGRRTVAVDVKGRELDPAAQDQLIPKSERLVPARPGHNVVLSLDLALQAVAWKALAAHGKAGAVAVVDVHTGFVLALVSYPAYDPNELTGRISRRELTALVDDPLQPLFARAIQQHYHPGSTFKVVTALAALAGGYVTPQSTTTCNGGYKLGRRRWRCWKKTGHGPGINLRRALQHSCDTYFYWLADKMGLDPIAAMAFKLGFGRPTGIEIGPEAPGVVPTVAYHEKVDHWYSKGFALNAAIGQGAVNVTALQLAMAYATIANGGTLYRPHLVRRIEDAGGHVLREVRPEVVRTLGVTPANLTAVVEGLKAVVARPGGTAYARRLADVAVAGKTGTAQNVVIGETRTKLKDMPWAQRDHAWFASFAPADAPEIAVAVVKEHSGEGATAAEPVAMAVYQEYFDLKRQEAKGELPSAEDIAQLRPHPRYASQLWAERHPAPAELTPEPPASLADDPASTPAEVADPDLLRAPATPALAPGGR